MDEKIENWLGRSIDELTGYNGLDHEIAKEQFTWILTLTSLGMTIYIFVTKLFPLLCN